MIWGYHYFRKHPYRSLACFRTNRNFSSEVILVTRHCCLPKYGIRVPVLLLMDQLQVVLAPPTVLLPQNSHLEQVGAGNVFETRDATWRLCNGLEFPQVLFIATRGDKGYNHFTSLDSTDELSLMNQHILYVVMKMKIKMKKKNMMMIMISWDTTTLDTQRLKYNETQYPETWWKNYEKLHVLQQQNQTEVTPHFEESSKCASRNS